MAELFEAVASWQTLLLALLVFGFAPGFVLRLLVFAYPRSDPRRRELIAELYAMPRIQRPLWVAEQLEVALFEGLAHRIRAIRSFTRQRRARTQTDKRAGRLRLASGVVEVGSVAGGMLAAVNLVLVPSTYHSMATATPMILAVALTLAVILAVVLRTARPRLSKRARRRFRP